MYLCARGINFASFYAFSIGFWNCTDIVAFFVFHFLTRSIGMNIDLLYHVEGTVVPLL